MVINNWNSAFWVGWPHLGCDLEYLSCNDLAPIDHFHIRGKAASQELAKLAKVQPGLRILDIGGGIGGAARMLASEFDCQVTVLDITELFCHIGMMLTERTGLSDKVTFQQGNAMALPFADDCFDIVWTQHSTMNIPDKPRMYQEVFRVLKPDERLAMHEIMAGEVTPILFPVPFAADESLSFLQPPDEIRVMIESTGLSNFEWQDVTSLSTQWYIDQFSGITGGGELPPLGLHLLFGERVYEITRNFIPNLKEKRMAVVAAVFEKTVE